MIQNQSNTSNTSAAFNFDTKRFLFDLLRFWWLFLITIPLSLLTIYIIHRYTTPLYRASVSLLMEVRGDKSSQSNSMMEGFGLTPGQRNMENQMAVLTSRDLVGRAIDRLDFNLSYYIGGRVKKTEMYDNHPFEVTYDSIHQQILNVPIYVDFINDKEFKLRVQAESANSYIYKDRKPGQSFGPINFEQKYHFGEIVNTSWGRFTIDHPKTSQNKDQELYFEFNNPNRIVGEYRSQLRTYRNNETSSIINVSVIGINNTKNIRFLNQLAKVFIEQNLDEKNQIATNTISFIEEQLGIISDSLYLTGSELSQFRTSNRIQSVSAKASYLFSSLQQMEQRLAQLELTKRYYLYLKDYFGSDFSGNEIIAPAQYQTDNDMLGDKIKSIVELNNQRLTMRGSYSEDLNLAYRDLETKIKIATNTLLKSIDNQIDVLDETIAKIEQDKKESEDELYQLPETERRLLGIERKYSLSNEVYTFLLRKRSEAQIQKASNTPDHQVLESAKYMGQIAPDVDSNRQKALMVGILLPLAFIALKQLLNNKVIDQEDIEKITKLPIIGQVLHNQKAENNVVQFYPKSVITESFRRVRTRLDYLTADLPCPIIGVTSSIPGEGKTFCAINLAETLALSGKKTAILGFDLRKPGLNKFLNTHEVLGITNYLIGKATLDEIKIIDRQKNLTIIPSGDIPPNPSELISSPKTQKLINDLKEEFDVVIMDTPPMGIVSDPFLLARYTDTLVFIVRENYSIKKVIENTVRNMDDEGIKNIGILINDVHFKKGFGYGNYRYSYNYRYNYGQGYYED